MLILKKENLINWTNIVETKVYKLKITQFIAKLYYKKKGVFYSGNNKINLYSFFIKSKF